MREFMDSTLRLGICLYDYIAQGNYFREDWTDISVKKFDKVTILETTKDGWILAKLSKNNSVGYIPKNYVKHVLSHEERRISYKEYKSKHISLDGIMDVDLNVGDEVVVLETMPNGWYKVAVKGKKGIVPQACFFDEDISFGRESLPPKSIKTRKDYYAKLPSPAMLNAYVPQQQMNNPTTTTTTAPTITDYRRAEFSRKSKSITSIHSAYQQQQQQQQVPPTALRSLSPPPMRRVQQQDTPYNGSKSPPPLNPTPSSSTPSLTGNNPSTSSNTSSASNGHYGYIPNVPTNPTSITSNQQYTYQRKITSPAAVASPTTIHAPTVYQSIPKASSPPPRANPGYGAVTSSSSSSSADKYHYGAIPASWAANNAAGRQPAIQSPPHQPAPKPAPPQLPVSPPSPPPEPRAHESPYSKIPKIPDLHSIFKMQPTIQPIQPIQSIQPIQPIQPMQSIQSVPSSTTAVNTTATPSNIHINTATASNPSTVSTPSILNTTTATPITYTTSAPITNSSTPITNSSTSISSTAAIPNTTAMHKNNAPNTSNNNSSSVSTSSSTNSNASRKNSAADTAVTYQRSNDVSLSYESAGSLQSDPIERTGLTPEPDTDVFDDSQLTMLIEAFGRAANETQHSAADSAADSAANSAANETQGDEQEIFAVRAEVIQANTDNQALHQKKTPEQTAPKPRPAASKATTTPAVNSPPVRTIAAPKATKPPSPTTTSTATALTATIATAPVAVKSSQHTQHAPNTSNTSNHAPIRTNNTSQPQRPTASLVPIKSAAPQRPLPPTAANTATGNRTPAVPNTSHRIPALPTTTPIRTRPMNQIRATPPHPNPNSNPNAVRAPTPHRPNGVSSPVVRTRPVVNNGTSYPPKLSPSPLAPSASSPYPPSSSSSLPSSTSTSTSAPTTLRKTQSTDSPQTQQRMRPQHLQHAVSAVDQPRTNLTSSSPSALSPQKPRIQPTNPSINRQPTHQPDPQQRFKASNNNHVQQRVMNFQQAPYSPSPTPSSTKQIPFQKTVSPSSEFSRARERFL